jgi:hypothetical protein
MYARPIMHRPRPAATVSIATSLTALLLIVHPCPGAAALESPPVAATSAAIPPTRAAKSPLPVAKGSEFGSIENPLAAEVRRIVQLPGGDGGEDVAALMNAAVTHFVKGDIRGGEAALDALADKVAAGQANLGGYSRAILDAAHIRPDVGAGDLGELTFTDRLRLVNMTWARAKSLHKTDPTRAARVARAAFLIAAHERLDGRWAFLRTFFELAPDEFVKVAVLDDAQRAVFRKLAASVAAYRGASMEFATPTRRTVDALILLPAGRPAPPELIKPAVDSLRAWKALVSGDLDGECEVLIEACIFRNVGRTRKDEPIARAARRVAGVVAGDRRRARPRDRAVAPRGADDRRAGPRPGARHRHQARRPALRPHARVP